MRIAITGSTGFIGSALVRELGGAGHSVTPVVRRRPPGARDSLVLWDPVGGRIDAARLEEHDAVIHLAGERIAGVWTALKKRRIRESRVLGTRLLCEALAGLSRRPGVLLSASAVGYYGSRDPAEVLDEGSAPGAGFLAAVAQEWEAATRPAETAGIRVARMRFAPVLGREGGVLAAMLPVFRLGLGGRLGDGRQVWSWIALDDVVGAALHVLSRDTLFGPINFAAPQPVTNAEFTRTLGRVLGLPTICGVPAVVLRLLLGEMAEEMLLAGARVAPEKLLESGYVFAYPELEPALRHMLRGRG
ncbi:MAG: TIGR01777 family protein [Gemmatimonadetes bacterium]|nr:TIGR01777 family protein [Gemmatimonadota bacterium]